RFSIFQCVPCPMITQILPCDLKGIPHQWDSWASPELFHLSVPLFSSLFSGQPVPGPHHPHREELLSQISSKSPLLSV
uniref:Uncharacterized protein n=1 Tax=Strigops habroptila TaxID=2489341 RepID=A0A672TIH0_STRHB